MSPFVAAGIGSGQASDFLGDRGQPGLGGGDDAVAVFVGFFVGDDRADVGGVGEFFDLGDGLGDVRLVVVTDRRAGKPAGDVPRVEWDRSCRGGPSSPIDLCPGSMNR